MGERILRWGDVTGFARSFESHRLLEKPILSPEMPYEHQGFRGDVIFPGGMILEDDGSIKLYYEAADTVECLAFTSVDELLAACHE